MKRTAFEAALCESTSKRVTYAFVHHRVCRDIELAEKLWQAALTERYHLTDQPNWKFEFLDERGKPVVQRWSTGIGLCTNDHIFALIQRDTALLYPPGKAPEQLSVTALEIYGCLDPHLWRHALPFVTSYIKYTGWYNVSYVNKASSGYLYGPESPFITAWASVRHLLPELKWKDFGLERQPGQRIHTFRPWLQLRRFEEEAAVTDGMFRCEEFQKAVIQDFAYTAPTDAAGDTWLLEWKEEENTWMARRMTVPSPTLPPGFEYRARIARLTPAGLRVGRDILFDVHMAPVIFRICDFAAVANKRIADMIRTGYKPPKKIKVKVTVPS